jgi:hypothetical protein
MGMAMSAYRGDEPPAGFVRCQSCGGLCKAGSRVIVRAYNIGGGYDAKPSDPVKLEETSLKVCEPCARGKRHLGREGR